MLWFLKKLKVFLDRYREPILYIIFGGLTTVVSFVSYCVLVDVLHLHYMAATVLSWVISVTFAYVTNRKWVFESRAHGLCAMLWEMISFFACRLASGFMEMGMMFIGVDLLCVNDKAVKLIANIFVIVANYILSKVFVFRKKQN